MSGLASLSATYQGTYTDSEGEDDSHNKADSAEKSVAILVQQPKTNSAPKSKSSSKVAQLVSYHDDIVMSDDEGGIGMQYLEDSKGDESFKAEEIQEEENNTVTADNNEEETNTQSDEDDIQLPPEPSGRCSIELQEKIVKLYKKMHTLSYDMNQVIQDKKDFRNPSIYEKLIQFCSINELGTNYPPSIYDPERWGKESFYDELSKAQKSEMERREKERKERTKVEIVSGTAKRTNSAANNDDGKNRKSKWDQVGGLASGISVSSLLRPVGVMQQTSFTTSGSGTKGTVISAFGSLPKRPKI